MRVTCRGYGGNPEALGSEDSILSVLNEYPAKFELRVYGDPQIHRNDGTITGFVPIVRGHVIVHVHPDVGQMHLDVYAFNKRLDSKYMEQDLLQRFGLKKVLSNEDSDGYPLYKR